jgi:arylsulfatase A-like enzyme
MPARTAPSGLLFVLFLFFFVGPLVGCGTSRELPAEEEVEWSEFHGKHAQGAPDEAAPDVLVVLIDALRPDHLGCYGYSRDTSPFLDRWAGGALRFEQAWTQASHTRMSVASLFTGMRPTVHRVRNVATRAEMPGQPDLLTDAVASSLTTLPESLADRGYDVWVYSANRHMSPEFGFAQGVTRWLQTGSRDGTPMVDRFFQDWRARRERGSPRPLFVYLHLMDVHNPYAPKPPWDKLFRPRRGRVVYRNGLIDLSPQDLAMTVSQYDGDIRYTDTVLERLLGAWDAEPGRPRATVVLADHGEEFQEHGGMGHGKTVFDEQLRIPLLVKAPGVHPGVSPHPVTTLDVHRLLLDVAGAEVPAQAQGRPFTAWSSPDQHPPVLYAEAPTGWVSFRSRGKVLLFRRDEAGTSVWFDEATDREQRNPGKDDTILRELAAALDGAVADDDRLADALETPLQVPLGHDVNEALRSLGYIGRVTPIGRGIDDEALVAVDRPRGHPGEPSTQLLCCGELRVDQDVAHAGRRQAAKVRGGVVGRRSVGKANGPQEGHAVDEGVGARR